MLTEYEKRKEKFRNPTIKKKMLWSEIKNIFDKHGYKISTDSLDKKFRNLKKTYLKIHDNNKKTSTGRGTVTWEYYDNFCNIFDHDKTISMDNTLSSMRVITENDKTINPEILDLSVDLNEPAVTDMLVTANSFESTDEDNPTTSCSTPNSTTGQNIKSAKIERLKERGKKRNYDVFRKDLVAIGKEKLQESKKLRESVDTMITVQKERNKIFSELTEYLKNK